jgi:lipopolysaccharide/colanic/teichoic acid biosynthesis glycosyltransferase
LTPAAGIRGDSRLRRLADLLVTLPALILLAPLLLLLAALVKLDSPGPAIYGQVRMGKHRRPFRILKFRSMVADAESRGPAVSGHRDSRVTRVGRLLRDSKLDELPQLLNVLHGEMTLVGPRAEVPRYLPHYTDSEQRLLTVRPGLTGPGQVYFTTHQAGELDGVADPEEHYIRHQLHPKLALDLEYLQRRSMTHDLSIVVRTLAALVAAARVDKP